VILVFNVILFSVTAALLSIEVAMYSILTFLITAKVIDLMIEGFEDFVGLMIVSDESLAIEQSLTKEMGVGMTIYKASSGFGKRGEQGEKQIIHTVINRIDIRKTYNIIDKHDKSAFIIEFHVNDIKSGILRKYLTTESLKTLKPQWLDKKTTSL